MPYSGRRHLLADAPPLLGPQPVSEVPRAEYLQCGGEFRSFFLGMHFCTHEVSMSLFIMVCRTHQCSVLQPCRASGLRFLHEEHGFA